MAKMQDNLLAGTAAYTPPESGQGDKPDADHDPAPARRNRKRYVPPQHAPQRNRGGMVVAAPRGPPLIGRRFVSYDDLVERGIRFSRVHLRRMELAGTFPMHVKLGTGNDTQVMVAWVLAEVEAWENARIAQRDTKLRLKQTAIGAPAAAESAQTLQA
jgi:predicted DNA-binding transcriptional regulator AlpA